MSPFDLGVLIHLRTTPSVHENNKSEAYVETIAFFRNDGIIKVSDLNANGYELTGLGNAWLTTILSTNIPEVAYLNCKGEVIA